MILRGWHIDGFGIFRDHRVDDLGAGVTVLHGPNEAGKSTLLAFIRGILFGFPDKRSRKSTPLYEPVHGGTHGGRLFVENDGRRYTIARRAGGRQPATITDEAGADVPEADLAQLLGGADAALFRNVFGFSLYELQELDTLTDESVRERIFSVAVAGAGRSARQAANALDKAAAGLYKPRGRARNTRVAHLLGELSTVDGELAKAQEAARTYPDKVAAERAAGEEVQRIRARIAELRARQAELAALLRLWPDWCARERALDSLESIAGERQDRLAAIEPDAALIELDRRAEELRQNVTLQRERLERAEHLRAELTGASDRLAAALDNLGEGWTEERVGEFRMTIPTREDVRAWERALADSEAAARQATERLAEAQRNRDAAETETNKRARELEAFGDPPPDAETLQARHAGLEELRVKASELARGREAARHVRDLAGERAKRVADLRRQMPGRGAFVAALAVALAGVAAGAGLAASIGEVPGLAVAGVALIAALAIALIARRRRRDLSDQMSQAEQDHTQAQASADAAAREADRLEEEVAAKARELSFATVPGEAEVAGAVPQVGHDLHRRRLWEAKARESREAAEALAASEETLETARAGEQEASEAHRAKLEDWRAWKAGRGFPDHLTPQGVMDFAEQIGAARELLDRKRERERALAGLRQEIESWETAARDILDARGKRGEETGEDLILAFTTQARAIHDEMETYRTISNVEAALAREAGNDPDRAATLRRTLAGGEAEAWQRERDDLGERLQAAEETLDAAVRAHETARGERQGVESSDRIAELETRRNALRTEIADAYRDWQVYTAGRELISQTLAAFERERQPAVFARAGEAFERITGGRYRRIVQDETGEGFYVVDGHDRRVSPIDLSRGTREQLYLAVRLGLVEEFSRRGTSLPLIMDEILVNFDPERMTAVIGELGACGADHQILMFTCHPFVADRVTASVPAASTVSITAA